jgi:tRNA1Val (adenine37-N6)-methyltransferase
MDDITIDSLFQGKLQVKQGRDGYRFSIDAVMLAYFARPLSFEKVLDLGTGCGIIPLILSFRHKGISIHGVEIQPELARIAAENICDNRMRDRVRIHCCDMKQVSRELISGLADIVLCNPPFHRIVSGRLNPNRQRAVARHEIEITLSEIVETASRMLCAGGRFLTVFPVGRMSDMLLELRRKGMEPKILRMVHPKENGPAKLFLVEGKKGGQPGLVVPPPLVLYRAQGGYTEEVAGMFLP